MGSSSIAPSCYAIYLCVSVGFENPGYDWLAQILFLEMKSAREDEPLVLKVVDHAMRERKRA
jgi:hypothetical protein